MRSANPVQQLQDVVDFFERVDRTNGGDNLVWAKSTAPNGMQVIINAETQNGKQVNVPPVRPGDPVCLSHYAQLAVLRDHSDLTQQVANGQIRLMTSAEANAYFQKKAGALKTSVEQVKQKARDEVDHIMRFKPLSEDDVDTNQSVLDDRPAQIDEVINNHIIHLCAQVSPLVGDDKMSARELKAALMEQEDSYSLDEWEYIRANGYYKSVTSWAGKKQAELALAEGAGVDDDDLGEDESEQDDE